jgi:hypothetical protein
MDRDSSGQCIVYTAGQVVPAHKPKFANGLEVNYVITDAQSDPASVTVDYSTDQGTTWKPATLQICSRAKKGVCPYDHVPTAPGPAGLGHAFAWDVYRDIGPLGSSLAGGKISLRLTATDKDGASQPDRCDNIEVPPQPGNVARFPTFEEPTFAAMARLGYTGFLAHVASDEDLLWLSGLDTKPDTYDDLLVTLALAPPVDMMFPATDDLAVRHVAMTPFGVAGLFLRVPSVQVNGGGMGKGLFTTPMNRILPGQPGYSPIWPIPQMSDMAGHGVPPPFLQYAQHFFENGRRYVADVSASAVLSEPDKDGDGLADAVVRGDGTRIARCVDSSTSTGMITAPCLQTPAPPTIPPAPGYIAKPDSDPVTCAANLPTFVQMAQRGYNAIVVDIIASRDRLTRLAGADGAMSMDDKLFVSNDLRDAAATNPDPQFQSGVVFWYPGANDLCSTGVGRAPDGRPALFVTVPDEDKNNAGTAVTDAQSGRLLGGGYFESNVGRPLPGEPGFSPIFNLATTWEDLRDITRQDLGCRLADHYWTGGTVYVSDEQAQGATRGPDADGDGCADSITLAGGQVLTR